MRADRAFYLATLALMITGAGTLALSGHAVLMPVACIPVCVINWYWHFSPNRRYLPDWAATLMCIAATFVTLASLGGGHAHLAELYANVPSAGRLLIFVAWVMLFRRKTPRDYAWLYVISFMMLVCTALLVPEVQFVLGFLALLLLALCAGSLLQVKAEAERSGQRLPGGAGAPERRCGRGFVLFNLTVALAILLPTALIFLSLPRGRPRRIATSLQPIQPSTAVMGFSESVELGAIGSVLDNPTRVMQASITVDGEPAGPDYVPLMRGMSFDMYDGRRWRDRGMFVRGLPKNMYGDDFGKHLDEKGGQVVVCDVTIEPLNTRKLFAPFALRKVQSRSSRSLRVNARADSVEVSRAPSQPWNYKTESLIVPPEKRAWKIDVREYWSVPRAFRPGTVYLTLPPNLSPRVSRLANEIAPSDPYDTPIKIARRMERYLFNNYAYSLVLENSPGIDPIEDFLFVRKTGYCEHYATAMALLLRCRGVPSRLVAGFKGGIYNSVGDYFTFRQSDAHSWVEAYVLPYGWVTFDPTGPSESQRNPAPRTLGGLADYFDYLRSAWIRYVIAYDHVEQSNVMRGITDLWARMRGLLGNMFFEWGGEPGTSERKIERIRIGPMATAALAVLCIGVAIIYLVRSAGTSGRARITVRFYARMLRFFSRRGVKRTGAMTPREFAQCATKEFPACAAAVTRLTRRFCDIRYGGQQLCDGEEDDLLAAVGGLKDALSAKPRK